MQAKYNFFDIQKMLNDDSRTMLPVDINAPVKAYFKEYPFVISWIDECEKKVKYAKIEFIPKDKPQVRIVLRAEMGMILKYEKFTIVKNDKYSLAAYETVKNKMICKKNINHGEENE